MKSVHPRRCTSNVNSPWERIFDEDSSSIGFAETLPSSTNREKIQIRNLDLAPLIPIPTHDDSRWENTLSDLINQPRRPIFHPTSSHFFGRSWWSSPDFPSWSPCTHPPFQRRVLHPEFHRMNRAMWSRKRRREREKR